MTKTKLRTSRLPTTYWRSMLGFALNLSVSTKRTTRVRACVPTSPEEVVSIGARAIDNAWKSGVRRMQIGALIPGLNPALEETFPYNDQLLVQTVRRLVEESDTIRNAPHIALLFKSAGTAAAALDLYQKTTQLQENVSVASFFRRDTPVGDASRLAEAPGFNIVVNPVNSRGDPVILDIMDLVKEQPEASWILINPDFTGDRSALGVREIDRRNKFLSDFAQVFYFRNLVRRLLNANICVILNSAPLPFAHSWQCDPREFLPRASAPLRSILTCPITVMHASISIFARAQFVVKRPTLIPIEKGILMYAYPGPWELYGIRNREYEQVAQFEAAPDRNQITRAIENSELSRPLSSSKRGTPSSADESADFLKVVTALALFASGFFWLLRTHPGS